ncbi:pirin family protein [Streptomyces sp. BI20]|uniref:pirin family protein n=1 Tax=Streptomyces sp. BI20 TaxID=3403460 RepID=UPI003C725C11
MTDARLDVRRAAERHPGGDPAAGIATLHAFSFGSWYDPDNLRFGPVIACNEEALAPGAGFAEHPHGNVEIVSWVVEGALGHADSTGREGVLRPGDVQVLDAGSGVRHTERNAGPEPLRFVQFWLAQADPTALGEAPSYRLVADIGDGEEVDLPRSGARLSVRRPGAGEKVAVTAGPRAYVHVVRGDLRIGGADAGTELGPGDALRITGGADADPVELVAGSPAELLVLTLP